CREPRGAAYFHARLCFRAAEPGPARLHARAEPDAGLANDDGLHYAVGLLLRVHLSARNDAVDFLRHRRMPADDLFHRTDARDHFTRSDTGGFLVEPGRAGRDGAGVVHAVRVA